MAGKGPISFELSKEHRDAIEKIAGGRKVRLLTHVQGSDVRVDFVARNAAFVACNASFAACNSAFVACNSAFKAE